MIKARFMNQAGWTLAGDLMFPSAGMGPWPAVVFVHGFDSGKDSPRGTAVAERLRQAGLATFLFDLTGHGESEGKKTDAFIAQQVDDLRSAIDWVADVEEVDSDAIGVNGASSGGLTALLGAASDDRVKAVVARGPRTDGLAAQARGFNVPILLLVGENDPLMTEARDFFAALVCDKAFKVIPGADHLFSGPGNLDLVSKLTAEWFEKKLLHRGLNEAHAA